MIENFIPYPQDSFYEFVTQSKFEEELKVINSIFSF